MREEPNMSAGTRLKAFICRICPFCIVARRWPDGGFARKMRPVEQHCSFCRAYQRVQQAEAAGTQRQ